MKRYLCYATREMQCGDAVRKPGELIARVELADDVPCQFLFHAYDGGRVRIEEYVEPKVRPADSVVVADSASATGDTGSAEANPDGDEQASETINP